MAASTTNRYERPSTSGGPRRSPGATPRLTRPGWKNSVSRVRPGSHRPSSISTNASGTSLPASSWRRTWRAVSRVAIGRENWTYARSAFAGSTPPAGWNATTCGGSRGAGGSAENVRRKRSPATLARATYDTSAAKRNNGRKCRPSSSSEYVPATPGASARSGLVRIASARGRAAASATLRRVASSSPIRLTRCGPSAGASTRSDAADAKGTTASSPAAVQPAPALRTGAPAAARGRAGRRPGGAARRCGRRRGCPSAGCPCRSAARTRRRRCRS